MRKRTLLAAGLAAMAVTVSWAGSYPSQPIRIVVPGSPGGAPDQVARILAERLGAALKQTVFVENKPGANGQIGSESVANSPRDGYTLLMAQDTAFVANPYLYKSSGFRPRQALMPVATIVSNEYILAAGPAVPATNLKELIAYGKRATEPLTYSTPGSGSIHNLLMELFGRSAGIKLLHIPYKGAAAATLATVSGEVQLTMAATGAAPFFRSGRLKPLAMMSNEPSVDFPELPVIGKTYPEFNIENWLGLFAPRGTPQPVIDVLRAEIGKILSSQDLRDQLAHTGGGLRPLITTPAEFERMMDRQSQRYSALIKELNLVLE